MADAWRSPLRRWTEAGLIDPATAARIDVFEEERARTIRLQRPIWIALIFGALMFGAGALLFVAAHWDTLSPGSRFALVLSLLALIHLSGAVAASRFAGLAAALHAVGTIALGAGVFLVGQIFNLEAHWPAGLMLWTAGAAVGWALLRDAPQLALAAVLAPAWLHSEWFAAVGPLAALGASRISAAGLFLLSVAYFTAPGSVRATGPRRVLLWLGAIALPVAAIQLVVTTFLPADVVPAGGTDMPAALSMIGWAVSLGVPLALGVVLHRTAAWPLALAVLWVLVEITIRPLTSWSLYAWWAVGALALAAWGARDGRSERINMAAAIFAATVLAFYFSEVMDRLGRSTSLIGLGILFLAGGWALERARRRLVLTIRGERT